MKTKPPVKGVIHHFDEITEDGSMGYATLANAEKGRKLVLEDPIRELGTHTVPVHLARDVTTSLTVSIEAEE